MKFLDPKTLYTSIDACLDYLKNIPRIKGIQTASERRIFHCYWGNEFGAKPCLSIKSFLATQDLSQAELWLWLDKNEYANHQENQYVKALLSKINVRCYIAEVEAAESPLSANLGSCKNDSLPSRSDVFRHLILYKYGGLYFDLDVLFLRNFLEMFPILPQAEFCYQWGKSPWGNSAILCLEKYSVTASYLIQKGIKSKNFAPPKLFDFEDKSLDILMLPSTFFDPLWLRVTKKDRSRLCPFASFEDFFQRLDNNSLGVVVSRTWSYFSHCFSHHWHNQWTKEECRNSVAGYYNSYYDSILEAKYGLKPFKSFI